MPFQNHVISGTKEAGFLETKPRRFQHTSSQHGPLMNNARHKFALRQTMMMYSANTCVTWIPKNGCSSLRFSIAKANGCIEHLSDINWINANMHSFNATTETAFRSAYSFIVLRCPFSRLVSAFFDKLVSMDMQAWHFRNASGRKTHPHDLTFKKFIQELEKMPPGSLDVHWRKQSDFLLFKEYDAYFSLENFATFSKTIMATIGLEIVDTRPAIGHDSSGYVVKDEIKNPYNASALELLTIKKSGFIPNAKLMFDDEITAIVNNIYREDINLYNQQFGKSELMELFS